MLDHRPTSDKLRSECTETMKLTDRRAARRIERKRTDRLKGKQTGEKTGKSVS